MRRRSQLLRIGPLGQNTIFGVIGLGARAVIQAAYLILLSRCLGASGYGLFSGSIASIMLVSPLAGWGVIWVVMQYVGRDLRTSRALWATALEQTGITGIILTLIIVLAVSSGFRERLDFISLVLLGLAELVVLPMAQAGSGLCFALGRGEAAAMNICVVPAGRVLAAIAVVALGLATPEVFAASHFVGTLAGIAITALLIARIVGRPDWRGRMRFGVAMRQGSSHAVSALFNQGYLEIDKVVMLQLLGAAILGPYTAAFRVMMVFVLPLSALISAALPRLFADFEKRGASRTFKPMIAAAVLYGIAASIGAWLIAPWMQPIFGPQFDQTKHYVCLLAPWPLLFALHQCGAAALTASGRQHLRATVEGFGFLQVAILNLVLLRRYGSDAAVAVLLSAEAIMALACGYAARGCWSRCHASDTSQ